MNTWLLLTAIVATFGVIIAIVVAIVIGELDPPPINTRPRINLHPSIVSNERWIGQRAYQLHRQGKAWNKTQAIHLARIDLFMITQTHHDRQ